MAAQRLNRSMRIGRVSTVMKRPWRPTDRRVGHRPWIALTTMALPDSPRSRSIAASIAPMVKKKNRLQHLTFGVLGSGLT